MGIKNDKVLNKTGTEYLVSKIKTLITQSINGLATVSRTGSYNDLSDKPENAHIIILLDSGYTHDELVTSIVRTTGQQYFEDGKTLIVSVDIVIEEVTGTRRAVCELYCKDNETQIIQGSIFYDGNVYGVKGSTLDDWNTASVSFNSRIDTLNSDKQNKSDNTLTTVAKTIVGAINELVASLATKVDGVKGNAESSYRTGEVNITASNLGFNWSGQSGQPTWLWGGNSNNSFYVYNPSNFSVSSATTASKLGSANKGSATNPIYLSGGSPVACSYSFNQNLNTSSAPTFSQLNLSNQILKTSSNVQIVGGSDSANCYIRGGTVQCARTSSLIKVPIYASSFVVESSKRVKENITFMSDEEAKKILDVNVVDFDYIKEVGGLKNQHGVIAEELLDIIPSAVNIKDDYDENDDSDEMLFKVPGVDYAKLVPYLIKTVQIQQKEIDELKERWDKVEKL